MTSFATWLVLLLGALIPPALSWLWGRQLHRHLGDPLFPERYWRHRRSVVAVSAIAGGIGGFVVVRGDEGVALLLLFLAILTLGLWLADYVTRKPIFDETWSFATYAGFHFRFALVFIGFWLAIGLAPFIVKSAGAAAPVVSVVIVAVLLMWQFSSSRTTARLLGATPLDDEGVRASLAKLLAKTTLARPYLFQAGPPGGVIANALALPSLRGGGVLFFRTLLERLSPLEIEAILAHELAHLEQFDVRVLRRQRVIVTSLIVIGGGVIPYVMQRTDALLVAVMWMGAVLAGMVSIGKGAKGRETAGDLRAAELMGDPEALIAALIRLYAIGHLPRRWDASTESRATHPALARRIRALRAITAASHDTSPMVIPAREPGDVLVFDTDRLRHLRGVSSEYADLPALIHSAKRADAFPYDTISSVHIVPLAAGADVVIEGGSNTLARVAVAPEYVPVVQQALDRFDAHFTAAAAPRPHGLGVRFVAGIVAVLGYFVGPAVVLVQTIVAIAGSSPRAGAAAATATTALSLYVVNVAFDEPGFIAIMAILSVLAWFFAIRWRRHVKDDGTRARVEIVALSVWAVASLVPFLMVGGTALRIAQLAFGPPVAIAAVLSVAAWLWFSADRRSRLIEVAVLALVLSASAIALIGTTWFLDSFSDDPFLATRRDGGGKRFSESAIEVTSVSTSLMVPSGDLRLSPNGRAFVIIEPCEDEDDYLCPRRHVAIGDMASLRRTIEATDVQFLDDARIVILTRTDRGATLRTETVAGVADAWTVTLDVEHADALMVDTTSGQWAVTAQKFDERLVLQGRVGHAHVARTALPTTIATPDREQRYLDWVVDGTAQPIGVARQFAFYNDRFLSDLWRAMLPLELRFAEDTTVMLPTTPPQVLGATQLDLRCFDAPRPGGVICVADDGRRTHVSRVSGGAGRVEVVGWLDGTPFVHDSAVGNRFVLSSGRCTWRVMDVAAQTVARLRFPPDTCPSTAVLSRSHVGVLVSTAERTTLQVFAIR